MNDHHISLAKISYTRFPRILVVGLLALIWVVYYAGEVKAQAVGVYEGKVNASNVCTYIASSTGNGSCGKYKNKTFCVAEDNIGACGIGAINFEIRKKPGRGQSSCNNVICSITVSGQGRSTDGCPRNSKRFILCPAQ